MSRISSPELKKRLGQHHLVSSDLCKPLLDFLRPVGRRVLEVGPGGGILTSLLLDNGARVQAIEMDPEWAYALRRSESRKELEIVVGDAMALMWDRLVPETLVTGNLPYQIATALIERLLPLHELVPRASFLVQREVGERLVARPGSSAYGSLSVLVSASSETELLGLVARSSFRPPPRVEGAFVGIRLLPPPLPEEEMREFAALVRLAFAMRRKTLRNSLATGWSKELAGDVVAAFGKGDRVRAEELDVEAFLRLHEIQSSLR